jgi:hypothetical protein
MALYDVSVGNVPQTSDVNQLVDVFSGLHDVGTINLAPKVLPPTTVGFSLALQAGSTLGVGVYQYKFTYVTGYYKTDGTLVKTGETDGSPFLPITTTTGNTTVKITLPIPTAPSVVATNIYRTHVGGTVSQFVATVKDGTTTYTDSKADTSVGANIPTTNTTGTFLGGNTFIGAGTRAFTGVTNLATITTPGFYYMTTTESAAMTDHPEPNTAGWFLFVSQTGTIGEVYQEITKNSTNGTERFIRVVGTTAVGAWESMQTAALTNYNGYIISLTVDLDTVFASGFYYLGSVARPLSPNKPMDANMVIQVYQYTTTTTLQIATMMTNSANSIRQWVRYASTNVWGPWREVAWSDSSVQKTGDTMTGNLGLATMSFNNVSGMTFDIYGNIKAPSTASDTASWNVTNKAGTMIFKLPVGNNNANAYVYTPLQIDDTLNIRTSDTGDVKPVITTRSDGDTTGNLGFGVAITGGGLTVIGGGESAGNQLADPSLTGGSESLWLTADSYATVRTNMQNGLDPTVNKDFVFGSDGSTVLPGTLKWASIANVGDANAITASGFYYLNTTATNIPVATFGFYVIHEDYGDGLGAYQIAFKSSVNQDVYTRRKTGGNWQAWTQFAMQGTAASFSSMTSTGATTVSRTGTQMLSLNQQDYDSSLAIGAGNQPYNYIGFNDKNATWKAYVGFPSGSNGSFRINNTLGDIQLTQNTGAKVTTLKNTLDDGNGNITAVGTASSIGIEAWTAPTLLNAWTVYNSYNAGYYKNSFGEVNLRGYITGGTKTSGTALFTLPAGYRPKQAMVFNVTTNGISVMVAISTVGSVTLNGDFSTGTYLSLDTISFRAEQ